jgi:hypothetical protein
MTNFIGSSGESEERAAKGVEHVGKNQWNGTVYKTRKRERSNGSAIWALVLP